MFLRKSLESVRHESIVAEVRLPNRESFNHREWMLLACVGALCALVVHAWDMWSLWGLGSKLVAILMGGTFTTLAIVSAGLFDLTEEE